MKVASTELRHFHRVRGTEKKPQGAPGKRWRAPWDHHRGVRLCS